MFRYKILRSEPGIPSWEKLYMESQRIRFGHQSFMWITFFSFSTVAVVMRPKANMSLGQDNLQKKCCWVLPIILIVKSASLRDVTGL
jgi:hypothetical protein